MKIAGIVLAGGQSSRYGQPKMFEMFAGQPLYKHSLIALQKISWILLLSLQMRTYNISLDRKMSSGLLKSSHIKALFLLCIIS